MAKHYCQTLELGCLYIQVIFYCQIFTISVYSIILLLTKIVNLKIVFIIIARRGFNNLDL